jgi:hypothetical protein
MDISDDIYIVLPLGARPIFTPTSIDPGATVSSHALAGALTKHRGGQEGSRIKLKTRRRPVVFADSRKARFGFAGGTAPTRDSQAYLKVTALHQVLRRADRAYDP